MQEKFLCFIHSSYLCSRRQKMQSIMKKKTYIIIAFCTFLTTETSAQQQVSFGPLHSPDSPREEWLLPGDTVYQAGKPMIYQGKPVKNAYMTPARLSDKKETLGKNGLLGDASLDSTYYNNPISNLTNSLSYPLGYGWGLHKGLNLSVDLSQRRFHPDHRCNLPNATHQRQQTLVGYGHLYQQRKLWWRQLS